MPSRLYFTALSEIYDAIAALKEQGIFSTQTGN
jgi:hypothetical protein